MTTPTAICVVEEVGDAGPRRWRLYDKAPS